MNQFPEAVEPQPVADAEPAGSATERTGHRAVDEVLESVEGLHDRPLDEHVAVFESAHEKLRSALTQAGDDPVARGSAS